MDLHEIRWQQFQYVAERHSEIALRVALIASIMHITIMVLDSDISNHVLIKCEFSSA